MTDKDKDEARTVEAMHTEDWSGVVDPSHFDHERILREMAAGGHGYLSQGDIARLYHAADEITRLRAGIEEWKSQCIKEQGRAFGYCAERNEARARVAELEAALDRSVIAIDDWVHTWAPDHCNDQDVDATWERIFLEGGTLAYIADIQKQNRAALNKQEQEPSND